MKQLALILLALCSSFFANAAITKSGNTLTDTSLGLKYKISGTNLEVSSYTGSSTEVTIPATVVYSGTTYTVTRIGKEAFKNSGIKEITIPATVTTIGASAFAGCDLETIVFEGETPPVLETEKVKQWWDFLRWFEEEVGAFDSDDDMTVIVPEGCEEAYAGASGWSSYIEYLTTDYTDTEWIGTKNNDWTNKNNWTSGVPTKYKNAIIHKVGDRVTYKNKTVTVSYYPIIAGQKNGSGTSYNNTATCNNIAFAPGAGVLGLHKLTYKRAVVQCHFDYDRWYAMTNPLKEMYSGDLYLSGMPLTYLMKFDKAHTENGHTYTQKWTKTYTGLQEPLVNGEGFAFKISSKCRDNTYKSGTGQEVIFPRTDESGALITTVYKYNPLNGKLLSKGYTLDKTAKAYRFAMENEDGTMPTSHTVNLSTTGCYTLIGNPLMSHLNIASFVSSNSSIIENTILLPSENSNASIVVTNEGVVAAMENNDAIIAPLQAFFVIKKAGSSATSVTFNASNFTTDNGGNYQLKSSENSRFGTLYVTGDVNGDKSYMSFWYNKNAQNGFVNNEDAEKVFNQNADHEIYTVMDGKPADISQFNTLGYEAPIAITGGDAQGDTITLTFKGAESFENVDVLLVNRQTGEEINLKDESSYTYEFDSTNATGNLYIVFRESEQITTSAEVAQNDTESINIYAHAGKVNVVTGSHDEITSVMIYDMSGKMLSSDSGLSATKYEKSLGGAPNQVVIVKVMTTNGSKTETIILKQ